MEQFENVEFFLYVLGTIVGIIAFWFNLKGEVSILKQKIAVLEASIEELIRQREIHERLYAKETENLKVKIENVDKNLIKISTELEINNVHLGTMLEILSKRIERIELK
jgi:hypothetical protein